MYCTSVLLFILLLGYCQIVDPACTYPSELQNAQWTSSLTDTSKINTYSTLTFTTSNLTIDFYEASVSTYSCFLTDGGNKYLLRSSLINTFGFNVYRYICFDFRRQNSYSYAFYVLSHLNGTSTYYQTTDSTISATIDNVCINTKTDGEYYVLIRKSFETSAQQTCITPLLGVFYYSQRDTVTTCASGKWDICNSNSTQISISRTGGAGCIANPGAISASSGYVVCVASVVGTYYYQTTYFSNTQQFVCMTVGYSGSNVSVTQVPKICEYTQTPTSVSTAGTYFTLVVNETCVPVTAQSSTSGQASVGLIVGVVVGVVIVLAIVCGVLWYKLYWVKKKKASITKITENRREKFQDPYLEEKDKKSTITREDVIFDIDDEDHIKPSAPTITTEGDTPHSITKVANGHAVTQSNGHVPDNGNTMEEPASVSPYMEDPAPVDDSSSVNRRPEKFKSLDLDKESSFYLRTINEVEDEEKPPVAMTTKTTNLFVADPSAPESLTPVSGEI